MSNETKAPQPPAEAQPVAWLGANPRTGVPELAFKTPAPSVMRDFAMRPLYAHPPPSAPVGVEGHVHPHVKSSGCHCIQCRPLERPCDCVGCRDLAQQPAADGGFTAADMMDARQEGRKEAQQPAAVGEAMVRTVAKAINAELEGDENIVLAWKRLGSNERKLRDRMARAAIAALAAQQGGRSDD